MMPAKPKNIVIIGNNLAISWNDNTESFIENKRLRDVCPCANCSGETDVFGNVYKGNNSQNNANLEKYIIKGYINIGHYAIRVVWGDGHNAGIYSFDLLKNLNDTK